MQKILKILLQSLQDKGGEYSGRLLTACLCAFMLVAMLAVSVAGKPAPEYMFWGFLGLLATILGLDVSENVQAMKGLFSRYPAGIPPGCADMQPQPEFTNPNPRENA